jgi:hypothetical protein
LLPALLFAACGFAACTLPLFAQEGGDQQTQVIIREDSYATNYYAIRLGMWWPKDREKSFTYDNVTATDVKSEVTQSQAIGLDFHYRKALAKPLYFDAGLQGWYSPYTFRPLDLLTVDLDTVNSAEAWVLIVPVTVGLSVAPLPENPVQPYAMAGIGAYMGISGLEVVKNGTGRYKADKQEVAFGGYIGAGIDLIILPRFGLSAAVKYTFCDFKEQLYTMQKNFTGLQILVGVSSTF